MNVNKWGPSGWNFLHTITFNYPLNPTKDDKEIYSNYFKLVGSILPCKYCRESYQIYYKYFPIDPFLDSREGVCYWLYKLHGLNQKFSCEICGNYFYEGVLNTFKQFIIFMVRFDLYKIKFHIITYTFCIYLYIYIYVFILFA